MTDNRLFTSCRRMKKGRRERCPRCGVWRPRREFTPSAFCRGECMWCQEEIDDPDQIQLVKQVAREILFRCGLTREQVAHRRTRMRIGSPWCDPEKPWGEYGTRRGRRKDSGVHEPDEEHEPADSPELNGDNLGGESA